jgi:hypothetical protein
MEFMNQQACRDEKRLKFFAWLFDGKQQGDFTLPLTAQSR